ncbi:MAG TPA: hypothetical protein VN903_37345 [Polyangia bacterium]|nr:hypothetical protein [Polyangia bacterium]
MSAHRPIAVAAVLWFVCIGATATAAPERAPACRIEWRANASGGHDLDDACLPALSADGKRLLVTRMESGSFSFMELSVADKGRVLRGFSAIVSITSGVAETLRDVNRLLARDGYRPLSAVKRPRSRAFVISRGALKLQFRDGRLDISCGQNPIGRAQTLSSFTDDAFGPRVQREVLTALFLPEPATFALMKVEPVDNEGFYLAGAVRWIVVPFTARCR